MKEILSTELYLIREFRLKASFDMLGRSMIGSIDIYKESSYHCQNHGFKSSY